MNVVVWLIVSVTTAEFIYPWPLWVAGPWGAVLLVTTIMTRGLPGRAYGPPGLVSASARVHSSIGAQRLLRHACPALRQVRSRGWRGRPSTARD